MNKYINKVSIIVPVYNVEKYLSGCIESLLSQTYENIEIILVNDGSRDDSLNVAKEYADREDKIKLIDQPNRGAAAARNNGLSAADGYYVFFCDSDDRISPTLIEQLVSEADCGLDIVSSGFVRMTYEGKILQTRKPSQKKLGIYMNLAPWGKLFRVDLLRKYNIRFPENLKIAEDVVFNLIVFSKTDRIKALPITEYYYMFNNESVMNTEGRNIKRTDLLLDSFHVLKEKLDGHFSEETGYCCYKTAIFLILNMCKGAEKEALYQAYDQLFGWLKDNLSKKNRYFSLLDRSDDFFPVKIAIFVFRLLDKINLIKPALLIFSRI